MRKGAVKATVAMSLALAFIVAIFAFSALMTKPTLGDGEDIGAGDDGKDNTTNIKGNATNPLVTHTEKTDVFDYGDKKVISLHETQVNFKEDGEWKKMEEVKSLKETINGYEVVYISNDTINDFEVMDFNLTSITFKALCEDGTPVKVNGREVMTAKSGEVITLDGINIFDDNFTIGKESTTIKIQLAPNASMDCNWLDESAGTTNQAIGFNMFLGFGGAAANYTWIVKFNVSDEIIPDGQSILSAEFFAWTYTTTRVAGRISNDTIWGIDNQTWMQSTITPNIVKSMISASNGTFVVYNDTFNFFTGSAETFERWNVTSWMQYIYSLDRNNITFYLNNTLNSTATNNHIYTTQRGNTWTTNSQRPVLNVTIEAAPTADITPPKVFLHSPNSTYFNKTTINLLFSATDETALGTSWINYTGYTTNASASNGTITGVEGNATLTLYANDTTGNKNASSFVLSIDTQPPNTTLDNISTSIYNNITVWLQGTCADSGVSSLSHAYTNSTYFRSADNSPAIFNLSNTSALPDGTVNVYVFCNDTYGNNLDFSKITLTMLTPFAPDTAGPSIVIYSPNSTYFNTTTFNVLWNATDATAVDTVWYNYTTNTNITITANFSLIGNESNNTLTIWANDTAGNLNSASFVVRVDTQPPNVTMFNSTYSLIKYYQQVMITGICNDSGVSGPQYQWSNSSVFTGNFGSNPYFFFYNTSAIADITQSVYAFCNDSAGNIAWNVTTFTFDTKGPLLTLYSPNTSFYNTTTINLLYNSNDSATVNTTWYQYGGANTTLSVNTTFTASEGNSILILWANDSLGNMNYTNFTVNVDTQPPNVTADNTTSTLNMTSVITIQGTCNDSGSSTIGSAYTNSTYFAGVDGTGAVWNLTNTSSIPDGTHMVYTFCNDTAGNNLNFATTTFTLNDLDNTPPFIYMFSPNASFYNTTNINILFITNDTYPNSSWYEYLGVNTTLSGNTSFSAVDGTNTLTLWANDSQNNQNFSSFLLNIDTQPPNITLSNHTPHTTSFHPVYEIEGFCSDDGTAGVDSVYTNSSYFTGTDSSGAIWNLTNTSGLPDGTIDVYIICNDTYGNNLDFVKYTLTVDLTTPAVDVHQPSDNYYSTAQALGGHCEDIGHILNYSYTNSSYYQQMLALSGDFSNINFTNTSAIPDGRVAVRIYCNDSTNNTGFTDAYYWLDTIQPFTFLFAPNASAYNTSTFDLLEIASDTSQLNTTWYQYGGINVTIANAANATVAKVEGSNNLILWVNDSAGNTNHTNFTVNVDTQPPNITVDNTSATVSFAPVIAIQGTCSDNGIAGLNLVWTNNSNFTGVDTSPAIWNLTNTSALPDGLNTVYVFCNDSYNNRRTAVYSFSITSNSPPRIAVLQPANGTINMNGTFNITWTASDPEADSFLINITLQNATFRMDLATALNSSVGSYLWLTSNGTALLANYLINITAYENDTSPRLQNSSYVNISIDNQAPHDIVPYVPPVGGGGGVNYPVEYGWIVTPQQITMQMNGFDNTIYIVINNTGYSAIYGTIDLSNATFVNAGNNVLFTAYSQGALTIALTVSSDLSKNLSGVIRVVPKAGINLPVVLIPIELKTSAGVLSYSSTQQVLADLGAGDFRAATQGVVTSLGESVGGAPNGAAIPKFIIPVALTLLAVVINLSKKKEERFSWAYVLLILIVSAVATALLVPSSIVIA